jgi:hypothetical protein
MTEIQNQAGRSSGHRHELPSVKREYRVGPAVYIDPENGFPVVVDISATGFRCPHCGFLWRADFWTGNVRLGPGRRRCAQCGEDYDDGSREWPELPLRSKFRYCCPPIVAAICGGIAFAAVFTLFLPVPDWRMTAMGLLFACFPIFLFFLVRPPWVLLSIHRYNKSASPTQ